MVMVLGAVAGCGQTPPIDTSAVTRTVAAEKAFAIPAPGGPAITAVLQRNYANATQQDILLATSARTPGQNALRIQIFGPTDPQARGQTALRDGYLPIRDPASEIRSAFPGIRMQKSPYYVQNKYGPFGYAVGRTDSGDTCFFGWQRITSTGIAQTWLGNKGSIQIRYRLCEQGANEAKLLQAMYGFTITSFVRDGNWNPYGEPPAVSETLGRGGAPIYPIGVTEFGSVLGDDPDPAPSAPPRRRVAKAAPPAAPPVAEPIGPAVPLPPGAEAEPIVTIPSPPCTPGAGNAACP